MLETWRYFVCRSPYVLLHLLVNLIINRATSHFILFWRFVNIPFTTNLIINYFCNNDMIVDENYHEASKRNLLQVCNSFTFHCFSIELLSMNTGKEKKKLCPINFIVLSLPIYILLENKNNCISIHFYHIKPYKTYKQNINKIIHHSSHR